MASPCGIITAPKSALEDPEGDQRAGGRRQPGEQRGDGEAGHADDEHPAPADEVAGPGGDDQPDAKDIVYAASTHCRVLWLPPRSARIDGPARLAIVASSRSMTSATMTTAMTIQRYW